MKHLQHLLLAGSTLLPLAATEKLHAQESPHNVQDVNGVSRAQIHQLLRDLDDDRFAVREKASRDLAEKATQWIKSYGKKLPWKEWILPQEHYSLEVRKRLERILGIITQEERQLLWLPSRIKTPKEWWDDESLVALSTVTRLLKEQTGTEIVVTIPAGTTELMVSRAVDGLSAWQTAEFIREHCRKTLGEHFGISQDQSGKILIYPVSLTTLNTQYASSGTVEGELWQSLLEEKKGYATYGLLLRSEHKIPFYHWRITSATARTKTGEDIPINVPVYEASRPDLPWFHIPYSDSVDNIDLTVTFALTGYTLKSFTHKDFSRTEIYNTDICAVMLNKMEEEDGLWCIGGRVGSYAQAIPSCVHYDAYDDKGEEIVRRRAWENTDASPFQLVLTQKPHRLTMDLPEYEVPHTITLRFTDVPLRKK